MITQIWAIYRSIFIPCFGRFSTRAKAAEGKSIVTVSALNSVAALLQSYFRYRKCLCGYRLRLGKWRTETASVSLHTIVMENIRHVLEVLLWRMPPQQWEKGSGFFSDSTPKNYSIAVMKYFRIAFQLKKITIYIFSLSSCIFQSRLVLRVGRKKRTEISKSLKIVVKQHRKQLGRDVLNMRSAKSSVQFDSVIQIGLLITNVEVFSSYFRMDYDRALTSLNNDRTLTHQSAKKLYNAKKNVRFQDTV